MQWLRSSPDPRPPTLRRATMPPYATSIERAATFAFLDRELGRSLTRRVLHETHSEPDAIRTLLRLLPSTVQSAHVIPSGPDVSPAERALAIAQTWTPRVRAMLGLYLWGDIERDERSTLSGERAAARSVITSLLALGHALGSIPAAGTSHACEQEESDLLSAEHDATTRGHILACPACRARVAGFRDTMLLVRAAFDERFPPLPTYATADPAHAEQPQRSRPITRIAALVVVVALACAVLALGRAPRRATEAAPALRGDDVLARAAARFDTAPPGVLHERYQMSGRQSFTVERWSDVQQGRLRIRLTNQNGTPTLDLVADADRLHYAIAVNDATMEQTFEHPRMHEMLPMLWTFPDGGGLGSFPLAQRGTDVSFVRAAQEHGARHLGTTRVDGRTAYLLTYRQPADPLWQEPSQDIVLAIDAETYAVLRASAIGTEVRASARIVWQAETIEVLGEAPPTTFDTGRATPSIALPAPRQLHFGAFTNVQLDDVPSSYGMLPVPATLPAGTSLAFLREDNTIGIVQIYESKDATVALITSPPPLPSISLRRLDNHTGDTYWDIVNEQGDVTLVEMIRNTDPTHRTRMHVWYAGADAAERRTIVATLVASIRWIKQGSGGTLAARFGEPTTAR